MAMTLRMANQYSNSAKLPTCIALMARRPNETATTISHCDTVGNHSAKYIATAVTSAPIAMI